MTTPSGPRRLPLTPAPRRIAVLRALQLGDLLVAVPALRALRRAYPAAEITLIGLPWAADFAARFSAYLDRFVPFPGAPGFAEAAFDPARTAAFLAEQRACGYDLAIQMHGSGATSNPFAAALGARVTAGYCRGEPPAELTLAAPYPDGVHEVHRWLRLVALVGARARSTALEFPLHSEDRAEAARLLRRVPLGGGPLVGLHPGSRQPARRWPPEYFAALGDLLADRYGARIVLTGGPGEAETVAAVAARMQYRALSLASKTSLGGLAALLAKLDLFVSNDTGPAHLANAVDAPSVTIFGPADPALWAPLDRERHLVARRRVACSPCGFWECPIDHRCLRGIAPEEVAALAARLLERQEALCGA